ERTPEVLRLSGFVNDRDAPLVGELPGQQGPCHRRVRLVDEAEVPLESIDHCGVRAEQRAVILQNTLEERLPPGELQLVGDLIIGDVAHRELRQKWFEAEGCQLVADRCALDEVVEHVGLRGETGERTNEALYLQSGQRFAAAER